MPNDEGFNIVAVDNEERYLWSHSFALHESDQVSDLTWDRDDGLLIVGYSDDLGRSLIVKTNPVLAADDQLEIQPISFTLHPCYPNPFNPTTTISFDLTHPGMVKLNVFDLTGRQISTLIEDNMTSGQHQIVFDGSGLSSGIYFARLEAGASVRAEKMVLLK